MEKAAYYRQGKTCIGTFFDRVQKVLDHEGIESGFELQIAGYSNYNVGVEEIGVWTIGGLVSPSYITPVDALVAGVLPAWSLYDTVTV